MGTKSIVSCLQIRGLERHPSAHWSSLAHMKSECHTDQSSQNKSRYEGLTQIQTGWMLKTKASRGYIYRK